MRNVAVGLLGKDGWTARKTMLPYPFAVAENRDVYTSGQGDFIGQTPGLYMAAQTISAIGAGDPEYVFFTILVEVPGELEQVVRKPIHVLERLCVDSFGLR